MINRYGGSSLTPRNLPAGQQLLVGREEPMPTYYFDIIQIDGTYARDTIGTELVDVDAAKREAKRCLAEMSQEAINDDLSELRIEVRDADGHTVAFRVAHFASDDTQSG